MNKTDEFCERCGRNLTAMGMYADFTHYRADLRDREVPCVPYDPIFHKACEDMADELVALLIQKMDESATGHRTV